MYRLDATDNQMSVAPNVQLRPIFCERLPPPLYPRPNQAIVGASRGQVVHFAERPQKARSQRSDSISSGHSQVVPPHYGDDRLSEHVYTVRECQHLHRKQLSGRMERVDRSLSRLPHWCHSFGPLSSVRILSIASSTACGSPSIRHAISLLPSSRRSMYVTDSPEARRPF
jgi:hypothetical protein